MFYCEKQKVIEEVIISVYARFTHRLQKGACQGVFSKAARLIASNPTGCSESFPALLRMTRLRVLTIVFTAGRLGHLQKNELIFQMLKRLN